MKERKKSPSHQKGKGQRILGRNTKLLKMPKLPRMTRRLRSLCNSRGWSERYPRKKMRTNFTERQLFELEKMFETKKYLNVGERSNLCR